jgi:hypothetical protein
VHIDPSFLCILFSVVCGVIDTGSIVGIIMFNQLVMKKNNRRDAKSDSFTVMGGKGEKTAFWQLVRGRMPGICSMN